MNSFCFAFPVPSRYFSDMLEACMRLEDYYKAVPVAPRYVATMKRAYSLENARGQYGEFERDDNLLIFQGEPAYFSAHGLFAGSFPSPSLLREVEWEGIAFEVGLITFDNVLEQTLGPVFVDYSNSVENVFLTVEDYSGFLLSQTS